jgi:hypothetical protein
MSTASIQAHAVAYVTIDGVDRGKFDVFEDVETTADVIKHRDGGSPSQSLISVPSDTKTITVRRLYKAERDGLADIRGLRGKVGSAKVSVSFQDLDASFNAFGAVDGPYTGLLTGYKVSGGDSTGNDKRMLELSFEVS